MDLKKTKWLTQALIISGTLNIGLLSTFIYFVLREQLRPFTVELKAPPARESSSAQMGMQELLISYSALSFQDLLVRLGSTEHVEAGYTKRDLALASLVAFKHFNLERALGGLTLQKRRVAFQKEQERVEITIFPALADYQYQAIIQYAKTEKWPLTPEGLFAELKNNPTDSSLLETFSLSPQYHFIATLLAKTGTPLRNEQIIKLMSEGSWESIDALTQTLRQTSAFTEERRRELLIRLMGNRSKLAAALLLATDHAFIARRFNDAQLNAFLDLLGAKTPATFTKQLLLSPRSDAVWKKAASLLYAQAGETVPEPYDHRLAVARFIHGKVVVAEAPPTPVAQAKEHVVQEGESLWKIARTYKLSTEALMKINHLTDSSLKPGQKLLLPQGT